MLKLIKFFRGYLYVRITGYSPERFLNLCTGMDIVLWGIVPEEDGYSFYISRPAFGMIESALEKTGTQISVIRKIGFPFLAQKYRKHASFFIGIFCAAFLLYFLSLFLWKVEIEGNSYYSTQTILDCLEENGVGYASLKAGINCKELQNLLRKEFTDLTWVSAKIEGTRLSIVVQERLNGSTDEEKASDAAEATDLTASHAGTVESIVVRSGTPLVAVGDVVEEGDILVSGAIEVTDDRGETASWRFVQSDADVQIRTSISYEDAFPLNYEKKTLTGEAKYGVTFYFNEYELNLGRAPGEDGFLEINKVSPAVIGSDFYLPFEIGKKTWLEYESAEEQYTEEEIQTLAQEHLEQYCENLEKNGVQILSNSVMIGRSGENILVSGDLEALAAQSTYQGTAAEDLTEQLQDSSDTEAEESAE
ncbi:MAG: sporulation protein YqfD [Clostridiales bacterium]|nr:sporulation protein YqfD [Clostridiales bacterium]